MSEAEQQENIKRLQLDEITQQADDVLRDLRIVSSITELDELDSFRDALGNYRVAISRLWPAIEFLIEARRACGRAWTHVEEAAVRQARHAEFADRMERRAREAEIAYDTAR